MAPTETPLRAARGLGGKGCGGGAGRGLSPAPRAPSARPPLAAPPSCERITAGGAELRAASASPPSLRAGPPSPGTGGPEPVGKAFSKGRSVFPFHTLPRTAPRRPRNGLPLSGRVGGSRFPGGSSAAPQVKAGAGVWLVARRGLRDARAAPPREYGAVGSVGAGLGPLSEPGDRSPPRSFWGCGGRHPLVGRAQAAPSPWRSRLEAVIPDSC